MEFDSITQTVGMAAQVFFLDLLLSGDNALVIALACRSLPPPLMARAVFLGTGFAIVLRVLLTMLASVLLDVPLLKLVGAVLLIIIALKLLLDGDETEEEATLKSRPASNQLWGAVMVVVTADLVLSLDNVVALAAATQGSVLFLVLG
ncbi:MAG TPA: YjbE family putative metal transport protein, partial [Pseudogulbenkiania sp.]|nr:YjbE family putative metal transport protein [Pseudogulbenkiania sp.]